MWANLSSSRYMASQYSAPERFYALLHVAQQGRIYGKIYIRMFLLFTQVYTKFEQTLEFASAASKSEHFTYDVLLI